MAQKTKTYRSKEYMNFVKTFSCILKCPHCQGETVAHHVATGGVGMKGSDLSCIPLCNLHHQEGHNRGWKTFEDKYSVVLDWEQIEMLRRYVEYLEGEK